MGKEHITERRQKKLISLDSAKGVYFYKSFSDTATVATILKSKSVSGNKLFTYYWEPYRAIGLRLQENNEISTIYIYMKLQELIQKKGW